MQRLFADIQRATGGDTLNIGLASDLPGVTLADGEQIVLYDDEVEIQAQFHSQVIDGPRGRERYWSATLDRRTERAIA